ncbi:hypothetical protein B9N43_02160 [Denitratisoma sp. DHT3]|uniref:acyl-CoA dehydrogenase family protein n=1 Tax=Denitratisoma sp. DHT3 TaxID=1981880 RepID=UPI0011982E3D|nr:acyl-CoA dehydrogenase family protein [Denitratisoma sp. DHT3]QDX80166.1 hypothetical protein B9N43_02160 [Denitratisoma sp. DHT3]
MEFTFSEEQRAIADLATSVFSDYCSDEQTQKFSAGGAAYDAELWQQLRETGLVSLIVAEEDGGTGLGMVELMLTLEQQGRFLARVPLWSTQLAAAAVSRFAAPAAKSAWLADLAAGAKLAAISLEGLLASQGLTLNAEPTAAGWRLRGRAVAVALAGQSAVALLPAQTPSGVRLFLVDLSLPGIGKVAGLLTHGEPAADLLFDGLELPADASLAAEALAWLEPRVVACLGALHLGVSREALNRVVAYTSERVQFGRTIASFQAITQKTADCLIDTEALRSTLWQLCWRLDAGLDAAGAAGAVKVWACDCGYRVTHAAQHMHGGIGVDLTYPIHRFTLWSRALEVTFGGAPAQLAALGQWLASPEAHGAEL